jgi:hypothetical protein
MNPLLQLQLAKSIAIKSLDLTLRKAKLANAERKLSRHKRSMKKRTKNGKPLTLTAQRQLESLRHQVRKQRVQIELLSLRLRGTQEWAAALGYSSNPLECAKLLHESVCRDYGIQSNQVVLTPEQIGMQGVTRATLLEHTEIQDKGAIHELEPKPILKSTC